MDNKNKSTLGIVGLGTMGSNLLQNLSDHGYTCSGYDINLDKVAPVQQLNPESIHGFSDMRIFIESLKIPRIVILLVPAGKVVDLVIEDLLPLLDKGDILVDAGNSHFMDTERRYQDLEERGYHFVGMGISGGEKGARYGPSMMPGGDEDAYKLLASIFQKIAAPIPGGSAVAYMGKSAAGHFVKMVHNGMEYAIMQLLAEVYEILKSGLQLEDKEIYTLFKKWNEGRLASYLLEITRTIFTYKQSGETDLLLHAIKDEAKAKGTGKWTSQTAMNLNVAVPLIDIAVAMRDLSKYKNLRIQASKLYATSEINKYKDKDDAYLNKLEQAFYFSMVSAYAQGMHLLYEANQVYNYGLQLASIANIWRGGCIIRSAFLEEIYIAYNNNPNVEHLFLAPTIYPELVKSIPDMREIVADAVRSGIAIPAFSAAISYFDNFRNQEMPTNLIQAQRDYFGSHTYELKGKEGRFHTDWESTENR